MHRRQPGQIQGVSSFHKVSIKRMTVWTPLSPTTDLAAYGQAKGQH